VESAVPASVFIPGQEGFRRTCCLRKASCDKARNKFFYSLGLDRCQPVKPTPEQLVDQCAGRISEWFFDDDYFKALPGIAELTSLGLLRLGTLGKAYQMFFPCTLPVENYLEILFNERNLLDPQVAFNPFRRYILQSLPPCKLLTESFPTQSEKINAAGAAALASFRKVCPFDVERASYAVDRDPSYACGFDVLTRETFFGFTATCAEGSRCGCPIVDQEQSDFTQSQITSVLTNQLSINKKMRQLQNLVPIVLGAFNPMASVAYSKVLAQNAGAIEGALRGIQLTASVFSATAGVIALSSCTLRIGCFVFECKKTVKGCRLTPEKIESDFRSLYFMIPPPLQSCSWLGMGCALDTCSQTDLRLTKIGMNSSRKGKSNFSGVFNCQALAYKDMNQLQKDLFAEKTKTIYDEAQTVTHQIQALRQNLLRVCPWMVRSFSSKLVRCLDLEKCDTVKNPACCSETDEKKIPSMDNICPKNYILCLFSSTQRCVKLDSDDPQQTCGEGRWKPCPNEEECPFAVSFPAKGHIQCNDLSIVKISDENKKEQGWCATKQGIRKCPLDKPWMCDGKECQGEHCCEKQAHHCEKKGGVRYCVAAYRPQNSSFVLDKFAKFVDIFQGRSSLEPDQVGA